MTVSCPAWPCTPRRVCSLNGNVMLNKTGHLSKYKSFLICRFANVTSALSELILFSVVLSGLILFSVVTFTVIDITMLLCVLGSVCLTLCDPMNCSSPGSSVA